MTTATIGSKSGLMNFPNISDFAYIALQTASKTAGVTKTIAINKALQLEAVVQSALTNGGEFGIRQSGSNKLMRYIYPDLGKRYCSLDNIAVSRTSQDALQACIRLMGDEPSAILNQALRRWRDVVDARANNGHACIKMSYLSPQFSIMQF